MSSRPTAPLSAPPPVDLDATDRSARAALPAGLIVDKRLARLLRPRYEAPAFVIEFIVGLHCASEDPAERSAGLARVEEELARKIVSADEVQVIKHRIADEGSFTVIENVSVEVDSRTGDYSARLKAVGERAAISRDLVVENDRVLAGGLFASVRIERNQGAKSASPYRITQLKPFQLSKATKIDELIAGRSKMATEDWKRLLIRSIGIEPDRVDARTMDLLLLRMVPYIERGYNLAEFGPKETGKTYFFKELSPASYGISGGTVTAATLFTNNSTNAPGLVTRFDLVYFDEVSGVNLSRDVADILLEYMESGTFARGKAQMHGSAGIVLGGNFDRDWKSAQRMTHLFEPLPDALRRSNVMDRIHAYLPGWEMPKLDLKSYTNHYGLNADALAGFWAHLRSASGDAWLQADIVDLNARGAMKGRDEKSVRKTAGALLKLLYPPLADGKPSGTPTSDEITWAVRIALEMRRRVKEQQQKVTPGIEFSNTNFAFAMAGGDVEDVVTPEGSPATIIGPQPMGSGQVWGVGESDEDGTPTLVRVETNITDGAAGLTTPNADRQMRDEAKIAHAFIAGRSGALLFSGYETKSKGFIVEAEARTEGGTGKAISAAILASMASAVLQKPIKGGVAVMGSCTASGQASGGRGIADAADAASRWGAEYLFAPVSARAEAAQINEDLATRITIVYYKDAKDLLDKSLL